MNYLFWFDEFFVKYFRISRSYKLLHCVQLVMQSITTWVLKSFQSINSTKVFHQKSFLKKYPEPGTFSINWYSILPVQWRKNRDRAQYLWKLMLCTIVSIYLHSYEYECLKWVEKMKSLERDLSQILHNKAF